MIDTIRKHPYTLDPNNECSHEPTDIIPQKQGILTKR